MSERAADDAAAFCAAQYPRLVGGLALYLGDRMVAEELAQEALLRAFRRWERVSTLDSPEGWVWRVAMNLATSTFRRRAVERRARRRLVDPDHRSPAHEDRTVHLDVRRAVTRLPDRQRAALVLRFFLDLSIEDTATRMGVSSDAVRSLTKRGVAALRAELADDGPDATVREGRR